MKPPGIENQYELELNPISIRGKALELYALSNWDAIVTKLKEQGEAYIHEVPFWIKIWEASIVLADYLVGLGLDRDQDILEIGAGMGITGLFLAAFGHRVTITDLEDYALELVRLNVKHNRIHRVIIRRLDWNTPNLDEKYDVICGSELIYKETFVEPLIKLLEKCLKPGGTVYLAHDVRRKSMAKFMDNVQGRFQTQGIGKTLRGDGEIHRIIIHTLHPRLPGR